MFSQQIGGWSEELLIQEHADFFLKMKAVGNKIVYCDDIEIINQKETTKERSKNYQNLRFLIQYSSTTEYRLLLIYYSNAKS